MVYALVSRTSNRIMQKLIALLMLVVVSLMPAWADVPVKVGVLTYRPVPQAKVQWQPLEAYLQTALGMRVELTVYNYADLDAAIEKNAVDVVLTNPAHLIQLQHGNSLSAPLATLINREGEQELTAFGGVIFTRAGEAGINTLADLAGKRIAVASTGTHAFGNYQMQSMELLEAGMQMPAKDNFLITGTPQDLVLDAVLEGRAEVGFMRSGILETLSREGKLDISRIKIINRQNLPAFPHASSTRLYPEWPVAVLPQVDEKLARRITIALLALPPASDAARSAGIFGFTTPSNYSSVESLMRRLRMPPFNAVPEIRLADMWHQYREWIVALGFLLLLLTGASSGLVLQNRTIRQSQQRFATLFELSPEPMLIISHGLFVDCNMASARMLGYADKASMLNKSPADISPARQPGGEDSGSAAMKILNAVMSGLPQTFEWVHLKADGSEFVVHVSLARTNLDGDSVVLGVWHDITARKQAEIRLQLAASVFTHAREGIMITDPQGVLVDVNATFSSITGYSREEVLGKNPRMLQSGLQNRKFYEDMWQALAQTGCWSGEAWNKRKDGKLYAEMITISAVHDSSGQLQNYVALFTDITPQKEHQKQLEHIAHYDSLTGLPNRVLLADRLQQNMAKCQRSGQSLAVVYLDLDGFKAINDQHGHDVGDELLKAVAQRMKEVLREGDTLARIGGDEFVAVLVELSNMHDCEPVLVRLLRAAADPLTVGEAMLQVSASIGVTIHPQDGVDADQLMRHADQAMYLAKQSGKNRYHLFDIVQDAAVKTKRESLEHIRHALEQREFVLYYQPKVNMKTGALVGAEALIRWQHPQRGLLPPGVFLPLIENHPVSVELGEWVIGSALKQLAAWHAAGLDITVSVNIGARQLQQTDFVLRLSDLLAAHPEVNPQRLELEILETSALEDINQISEVMHACRALGVRFALDDFGTGYSSLTYLKRLPADVLKIDQSFVRDMLDDPDDLAIIEGIIGLATAFRREVIAEGVEMVELGELLLPLGCELAQGYGIARPMPAAELPGWAAKWRPDASWTDWNERPFRREKLAIVYAEVEHRHWVHLMETFVAGSQLAPPPMDSHQCRFGHWLDTEGMVSYGEHAEFSQVVDLHERVHVLGSQLAGQRASASQAEIQTNIAELHELRDRLVQKLRDWYRE